MKIIIGLIRDLFKQPLVIGNCKNCNHPEATHGLIASGNQHSSIHHFVREFTYFALGKKFFSRNKNKCRCHKFEVLDNLTYLEYKSKV